MQSSNTDTAIDALIRLAPVLQNIPATVIERACKINPWFSPFYIQQAASGIVEWLDEEKLSAFVQQYDTPDQSLKLGLITAGNLPFVGFHDILVGLLSNCELFIQPSRRDRVLTEWLMTEIVRLAPGLGRKINFIEAVSAEIDCLIATGSDNAARYFRHHFPHIPKVIRGNRTSVAILHEEIQDDGLMKLAKDVFLYNGLGCRNVSHVCMPWNFDIERLGIWDAYPTAHLNKHYLAVFEREKAKANWLGKDFFTAGKSLIVPENSFSPPPMSIVRAVRFENVQECDTWLKKFRHKIQCIAGKEIQLGESQSPKLYDYADGVDTMKFLRVRTLS